MKQFSKSTKIRLPRKLKRAAKNTQYILRDSIANSNPKYTEWVAKHPEKSYPFRHSKRFFRILWTIVDILWADEDSLRNEKLKALHKYIGKVVLPNGWPNEQN